MDFNIFLFQFALTSMEVYNEENCFNVCNDISLLINKEKKKKENFE